MKTFKGRVWGWLYADGLCRDMEKEGESGFLKVWGGGEDSGLINLGGSTPTPLPQAAARDRGKGMGGEGVLSRNG